MKKLFFIIVLGFVLSFLSTRAAAQCSVCTRTAQQMGEQPAKGLNSGILYLAFTPFAIAFFVGYRWWKSNRQH